MSMLDRLKVVVPMMISTGFVLSNSYALEYTIKEGDTLSDILFMNVPGKIYGAKGNLNRLKNLNRNLVTHYIYPGQIITLPKSSGQYTQFQLQQMNSRAVTSFDSVIAHNSDLKETNLSYSKLVFSSKFGFSSLRVDQGSNSSASSLSDLGLGFYLGWAQVWSETFQTEIGLSHMSYDYSVSSNKVLLNNKSNESEFSIGLTSSLGRNVDVSTKLGYRISPILRSKSATELELENISAGFAKLTPSIKLFRKEGLDLSLFTPIGYEFSGKGTSVNTDGGLSYGAGVGISHSLDWGRIRSNLIYESQLNSFDNADVDNQKINFFFGIDFHIGD